MSEPLKMAIHGETTGRSARGRRIALGDAAALAVLLLALVLPGCGRGEAHSGGGRGHAGKVLVIGVDAATWDIIDPLMARGRLPNLQRLRRDGASGVLTSIQPILSPVVWTTIATGRTPEAHGIHGFVHNEEGELLQYTNSDRRVRAVWNVLSERNKKANVVGWFLSYPADVVEGAFISDRNEGPLPGGAYPADLDPLLEKTSRDYPEELVHQKAEGFLGPAIENATDDQRAAYRRYEDTLKHYYKVDSLRRDWAIHLLRERPADLSLVFFKGTDPMAHLTWAFMDPKPFAALFTPPPGSCARFGSVIPRYYEFVDDAIGKVLAATDTDTDVIVVSDHGSGPADDVLAYHVNPILARLGLVGSDADGHPDIERAVLFDPTPFGGEARVRRRLTFNRKILSKRAPGIEAEREEVDRMKTRLEELKTTLGEPLFSRVEVSGGLREASPGEERFALDVRINNKLSGVQHTADGLKIAGDYLLDGRPCPLTDLVSVRWDRTGSHTLSGVILMAGPRVRRGAAISDASVYDVAPTLLRLLGMPLSREMKGRVLEEALDEDKLPPDPSPVGSYEGAGEIRRVTAPAMPEIDKEMEKRLRTLGYVQ